MYAAAIKRIAPNHDAAQVEAFMRVEHGTLDALSRYAFRREVRIACATINHVGPEQAAALARSFGS